MSEDRVRVAIVGCGREGSALLVDFATRPFIDVMAVCDRDPDSPGAKKAAQFGIPFVTRLDDLVARSSEHDLIIEVTGNPDVKPHLKKALLEQGNDTTIIVHDLVARLILSLAADAHTLVPTMHPTDVGIGVRIDEWSELGPCEIEDDDADAAG
ncbi:MAG: Gfo/Idh/MocA family oxidoreductase [Coriobacteriia bacterium]|nr:Gfo/Idh/MocA family oxidoreductase [Coriobacteriia bacterium]